MAERINMVSARELVGRRITAFAARAQRDNDGRLIHYPTMTLDDGSRLVFSVEEATDIEAGIFIMKVNPRRSARRGRGE